MSKETAKASAPVHQLVGQLRDLLERATPRPWAVANWGYADEPHNIIEGPETPKPATRDGFWFGGQKAVDWGDEWNAENAALIVAAINAMPALLAIAEAAQARMDTYDKGEDYTGGIRSQEWDNLRTALSSLPNSLLGGSEQHEPNRAAEGRTGDSRQDEQGGT